MLAVPSGLSSNPAAVPVAAAVSARAVRSHGFPAPVAAEKFRLPAVAAALVVLPVFLQAPWVRSSPMSASLVTVVLVACGVLLERQPQRHRSELGALLIGFSGSWLAGCLFWGWCRLHPLWHLPIEAFALPLALAGLPGRWRLACSFYLASLLGTAATDAAMAVSGVMPLWPKVLGAPISESAALLHQAAMAVIQPLPLMVIAMSAGVLGVVCTLLARRGPCAQLAAITLATTLAVDGLFLTAALAAPRLSGLI